MRHDILPADPRPGVFPTRTEAICKGTLTVLSVTLGLSLLVLLCLAIVLPQAVRPARAGVPVQTQLPRPEAGLFFKAGRDDALFEAPTLASAVRIDVNGQVVRVTVRQRFRNPSAAWLEGIYVFPLPERSAVDRLTMTVGERRIEGEIMARAQAERAYRQAAGEGRRASLLESERPNVFVTSVANVGPGEEILVEIQYQDRAHYEDGRYSLRFPMAVAPRYGPAPRVPTVNLPAPAQPPAFGAQPIAHDGQGDGGQGSDLFGPVRHPDEGPANPVSLEIRLDPGFALAALDSLYHPVRIDDVDATRRRIVLADGPVPADRDFVLEWQPSASGTPEAAVFAEEIDGESYLLVTLLPPQAEETATEPRPRDLVLVIDTSGSMYGPSLAQAKTALLAALDRLQPDDRFNLIAFDDTTRALFDAPRPADDRTLLHAAAAIGELEADGGTEMLPALRLALKDDAEAGRLRQVVFLTDGAVGNEQALFLEIADRLGGSRLFTVGIGSAPNSYFMRKAAEVGRGSFAHIGDAKRVASRMETLFRKLERPSLTDVAAAFPAAAGKAIESYPFPLPDLYAGEPVSFAAYLPGVPLAELEGALLLSGKTGGAAWQRRVALDGLTAAPGVAAVWARAKLTRIEDGLYRGEDAEQVRKTALAVALEHRLVTRHTSLVAIDDEAARPEGETLDSQEIARTLPQGWSHEKVFGAAAEAMPQRSAATPPLQEALAGRAIALPQTATPAGLQILIGLGLLCFAGFFLLVAWRVQRAVLSSGPVE